MLQPSQPGPDFSAADLKRVGIGPEDAGRILAQYIQDGNISDPSALLAALLKSQVRANCRYMVYPFSIGAVIGIQQVLPENPLRQTLILNVIQNVDTATPTERGFLFEPGPIAFQGLTAQDAVVYIARALNIDTVDSFVNPGVALAPGIKALQLIPPPINAITVINNSGNSFDGLIVEGV